MADNILHKYASWTYNISFHPLNGSVTTFPPGDFTPTEAIIASGGSYNPKFGPNFFIEHFKFRTVIGHDSQNRGTTAMECEFTILETYGVTFLNKYLALASELGYVNAMQMPLMVVIEFFGHTDSGTNLGKIGKSKFIPILISSMKIKITTQGATYACTAIPYNHTAFLEHSITFPATLYAEGKTVAEFFGTGQLGLTTAFNKFLQKLKDDGKYYENDDVIFDIDSEIASATVTPKDVMPVNKMPNETQVKDGAPPAAAASSNSAVAKVLVGGKKIPNAQTTNKSASSNAVPNKTGISFAAGLTIVDAIQQVISCSSYVRDQLKIPLYGESEKKGLKDGPVSWYKITTTVTNKVFDESRNTFARTFKYKISPTKVWQTRIAEAPTSADPPVSKTYNYIFTGENKDVIKFDLDFDTLFITSRTAIQKNPDRVNAEAERKKIESKAKEKAVADTNATKEDKNSHATSATVIPTQQPPQSRQQFMADAEAVAAGDLTRSIFSKSAADMLMLDLTIIGDPEFIKQDDVAYPSPQSGDSLPTDGAEVHIKVIFKTIDDYNSAGIAMPNNVSSFSGIFKILTVENIFRGGKFEQKLTTLRIDKQKTSE